jgi:small ligand-binding sensory domain FIST
MVGQSAQTDLFFASGASERLDTRDAVRDAAAAIRAARAASLANAPPPSLLAVFVSPHHAGAYERIPSWVREELGDAALIGASTAGVIAAGRELEGREALVLTAAWLADAEVDVRHFAGPPGDGSAQAWAEALSARSADSRHCLVFTDPATCDTEELLRVLDTLLPSGTKVGALATGTNKQPAALFENGVAHRGGAVVCLLGGAFEMSSVVAQSCRPIGEPYIVTRARGNVIHELNAGKPTDVMRKLYEGLRGRDHALFNDSLALGIELAERGGERVVRAVLGVDPASGALAVQGRVQNYQVVQFELRDRDTAAQDLSHKLRKLGFSELAPRTRGALLFSSTGRGERLFGVPHHDSSAFVQRVSPVSLSGCFGSGEIGPAGSRTLVHAFSSVYAVFSERPR